MSEPFPNSSGSGTQKSSSQDTIPATRGKVPLFVKLLGTLFLMCLGAGYLVGRANSPKWDDPTSSPALIRHTVLSFAEKKINDDWVVEVDGQGRLESFRPRAKSLSFRCGALGVKTYDPAKPTIEKGPAERDESTEMPRLGFSYVDTLGFLVGGTEAYTVVRGGQTASESWTLLTAGESVGEKIGVAAAAITLSGIGFGLGYYIGYDDHIRCGDPLFQTLLDDKVFWGEVESDFISDHHWVFEYLDPGRDTRHDFDNWPESVRPSSLAISDERQALLSGRHLVRVSLISRHRMSHLDLMREARMAHVDEQLPEYKLFSLSSFTSTASCSGFCLPSLE